MVGGFNDVEEAVSVSAATSEAKQKGSVSMSFQVQPCGDETAGARDVGSHIALACLKATRPYNLATELKGDKVQSWTRPCDIVVG